MSNNEKLSTQVIAELEQENQRLRQIIRALLRDTNDLSYYMDEDTMHPKRHRRNRGKNDTEGCKMSELLTHRFAAMSDRQIARKLLSLAAFIGKNETGIAKEKSIALLSIAAARAKAKMKPRHSPKNRGSIMKKEVTK